MRTSFEIPPGNLLAPPLPPDLPSRHKKRPRLSSWSFFVEIGAGDGNRTHVVGLEGRSITIMLHPHSRGNGGYYIRGKAVFQSPATKNARLDLLCNVPSELPGESWKRRHKSGKPRGDMDTNPTWLRRRLFLDNAVTLSGAYDLLARRLCEPTFLSRLLVDGRRLDVIEST